MKLRKLRKVRSGYWRPTLTQIVIRVLQKRVPLIAANATQNNAILRMLKERFTRAPTP